MKILITGDAGFVGRAFRKKFESQGHQIVGIDIVDSCRWSQDDRRLTTGARS